MKNIIAAKCIQCGTEYEADDAAYTCKKCGNVLDVQYNYEYIASRLNKETLANRKDYSMWRYKELLPIEEDSPGTPLRIGGSPLYKTERLGSLLGLPNLYIKDDGQNPTASLKDRASAIAAVRAKRAGMTTVACSSTGNAASSLAGNAAALGLASFIFVPERAPKGKIAQLMIFGAQVISVQGNYEDTFKLSAQAIERWGWYNRNAGINPYLLEGKKTVSLEIAEQLGFNPPDYVAVSVGDGCTIAGVWKGFKDLFELGFIKKLPKLISVQASECCPINRGFETGKPIERMDENTIADSIAVGVPRNGEKALRAIKESQGLTVNVSDEEILEAMRLLGTGSGVFGEPAGVAGVAGLKKAAAQGLIPADAVTVSIVTGNGLKDIASAQTATSEAIHIPPDLDILTAEFKKRRIQPERYMQWARTPLFLFP
jgi:threonine synthase